MERGPQPARREGLYKPSKGRCQGGSDQASHAAASRSSLTCPVWLTVVLAPASWRRQRVEEREELGGSECSQLSQGAVLRNEQRVGVVGTEGFSFSDRRSVC